jgi:hypothetical protein
MIEIMNNNYVYTDIGIIASSDITKKNYVFNKESVLHSISANNIYRIVPELTYVIQNSVDDIKFNLRCDEKILVSAFPGLDAIYSKNLELDMWLFHPWIVREFDSTFYTLDLSKYTSNHFDATNIFLFNHKILQMADTLNIEPYMIKEILCREAADYEQHIEVVKKYIEDNFCPFDEFLEYVSKNFTYKMPRYIAVDDNYAALLTSFIKYSSTKSKVLSKTNCKATSYKTLFQYPTDDKYKPLIKATKTFLEKNNIKFQEETHTNFKKLIVYSKPLFELHSRVYTNTLGTFIKASKETLDAFSSFMQIDDKPIYGSLRLLFSLKEVLFYNQTVAGIKIDDANIPYLRILKDDFQSLDSTVIVHTSGYYSKVMSKELYENSLDVSPNISLIITDAEEYITMSYTKVI